MSESLSIYNAVRTPPNDALKPIQAGRLRGKTDINPMWRIKALTEQFGPCGIGWKYIIKEKRLEPSPNGEIAAFVDIDLFYKFDGQWSEAVPGTGGSSFAANERNGKYGEVGLQGLPCLFPDKTYIWSCKKEIIKDSCTEPEQTVSVPPAVIALLLNDKTEHFVSHADIDTWRELYPAVDIMQELRNMRGWLLSNPTKRKTKRGMARFINSWLAKEQNRGGVKGGTDRTNISGAENASGDEGNFGVML